MGHGPLQFDKRLRRINRKHARMQRGVIASVNHDGLIIARPRRTAPRFPVRGMILLLAAFFVFKGGLYAYLGPITYNERVGTLASGTQVEQAGAWAMQADPVTIWIAQNLQPLLG